MSKLVKYYGVNFARGDYIFREGDPADVMYMIHRGKVQIIKGTGTFDEEIRILGEGEFIGEMAVINQMPRSASALAIEDCVLIKMDRESFDETVKKSHEFSKSVIRFLSDRLRETDELLMTFARENRAMKLHGELLAQMLRSGKRDASGEWRLLEFEPFTDRAARDLSWSREHVSSVIAELMAAEEILLKRDRYGTEWLALREKGG